LNFASILRQGLTIGPTQGIFFADRSGKSLGYCRANRGEDAFVLLCEVELGQQSPWHHGGGGVNLQFVYDPRSISRKLV
jgi:hypothetical protein